VSDEGQSLDGAEDFRTNSQVGGGVLSVAPSREMVCFHTRGLVYLLFTGVLGTYWITQAVIVR